MTVEMLNEQVAKWVILFVLLILGVHFGLNPVLL